jgi:hypothetical protein
VFRYLDMMCGGIFKKVELNRQMQHENAASGRAEPIGAGDEE